jgi:hypothetical protein
MLRPAVVAAVRARVARAPVAEREGRACTMAGRVAMADAAWTAGNRTGEGSDRMREATSSRCPSSPSKVRAESTVTCASCSAATAALPLPPVAEPVAPAVSYMAEGVLKGKLASFVTDWLATRSESEVSDGWAELVAAGAGPQAGAAAAAVTLERAAEAKAPERAAIGELLVLLVQRGAVTAADLRFALHEYLEFLEENLCDIPTLHANLAQVRSRERWVFTGETSSV